MAEEQPNSHKPEGQRLLFSMVQYKGKFSLQDLAFNANLQEFAQRADYIYTLYRENWILSCGLLTITVGQATPSEHEQEQGVN